MTEELWAEIGATMRALRLQAQRSLRTVERQSGWGRGTLSQIENGRSRPNREQVEWYDQHLGGDGLLVSMYGEARTARQPSRTRPVGAAVVVGDAVEVLASALAAGETVAPGATVDAGWTLRNAGSVAWTDRSLARVGAPAALHLISSDATVPVKDCQPGDVVEVSFPIVIPDVHGTLAAYWHIVDAQGRPCFAPPSLLPVYVQAQ